MVSTDFTYTPYPLASFDPLNQLIAELDQGKKAEAGCSRLLRSSTLVRGPSPISVKKLIFNKNAPIEKRQVTAKGKLTRVYVKQELSEALQKPIQKLSATNNTISSTSSSAFTKPDSINSRYVKKSLKSEAKKFQKAYPIAFEFQGAPERRSGKQVKKYEDKSLFLPTPANEARDELDWICCLRKKRSQASSLQMLSFRMSLCVDRTK